MNEVEFYKLTQEQLQRLAESRGLSKEQLNEYFELVDYKSPSLKGVEGLNLVFAQILMHACNATMLSKIIDWENKIDFIKKITYDFDAKKFVENNKLSQYKEFKPDDKNVLSLVEIFREGFQWDSSKSKPENKDKLAKRYAGSMIEAAIYVSKFKKKEDVLIDLSNNYKDHSVEDIVEYFRKNIKTGFSVALTCDFLKEFDKSFNDIGKPDVHIKDTLKTLYKDKKYKNEYEYVNDMREIVEKAKIIDKDLTVYKLDRMIWLICSNNFFLHVGNSKQEYLDKIK